MFQKWDDAVARIMWMTDFHITVTEGPPPAESLPTTPEQSTELNVFQKVKSQLIGAITAPPSAGLSSSPGPKRLIRLRRVSPDTNLNGVPDWWELANNFPAFATFNAAVNDPDNDGMSTLREFQIGTDPKKADTDGDGLNDLAEINEGTNPLAFTVPDITLEYAWREAEGEDNRVSSMNTARTITGKAVNGTDVRTWSRSVPISMDRINAYLSVNEIMGTNGSGTEMAWSDWKPWPGSARAYWRQTCEGDGNSATSPPPLIKHSFGRRDIKVRIKASRPMPVEWKIYLRKITSSYGIGQPGRKWTAQSISPNPMVLSLGVNQTENTIILSPPDTSDPGLPTIAYPLNEARTQYDITSIGTPAYPDSLDTDGDGLTDSVEQKIGTSSTTFSSNSSGLPDSYALASGGVSESMVQLVSHTRSLKGWGSSNQGKIWFTRSWEDSSVATQTGAILNYPAFNNKLDFLTFPITVPSSVSNQTSVNDVSCYAIASQFIPSQVGSSHAAYMEQKRVWAVMNPAPSADTTRTYVRVKRETISGGNETKILEFVVFNFAANQSVSTNYADLKPDFINYHAGTSIRIDLIPLEVIIHKKNASPPRDRGLLAKKGDSIILKISNDSVENFPIPPSDITWQTNTLTSHGTESGYTGNSVHGPKAEVTFDACIGKVRCEIVINNVYKYIEYIRKKDDPYGKNSAGVMNPKYKAGQPDFVGIAESENRLKIARLARSCCGSINWAQEVSIPVTPIIVANPGDNKCNVFIYHMATHAGFTVPLDAGGWPPRAFDWYDHNFVISGWTWHGSSPSYFPSPGIMVSRYLSGMADLLDWGFRLPSTSAHCGIIDYDGAWINAGPKNINRYPHISDADYKTAHYCDN